MLTKKSFVLFCVGLLLISSCASAPKTTTANRKLTPELIKAAILTHQQMIVEAITEHTQKVRPGVAILDIASEDEELGIFATEEIIQQLVKTRKFRVVDRDSIETILKEHKFQYSGIVSDETAVSIGRFIGASIIITGVIRQRNNHTDFSLKILDVETAEIVDLIVIPI